MLGINTARMYEYTFLLYNIRHTQAYTRASAPLNAYLLQSIQKVYKQHTYFALKEVAEKHATVAVKWLHFFCFGRIKDSVGSETCWDRQMKIGQCVFSVYIRLFPFLLLLCIRFSAVVFRTFMNLYYLSYIPRNFTLERSTGACCFCLYRLNSHAICINLKS